MKKVDKDYIEKVNSISYKVKFIDGMRFMLASLSNLIDNLAEWIHEIKCKDYDFFLQYERVKDDLIKENI